MTDTIFHKIQRGEIPAQLVYEDAHLFAFRDIAPQAPVHVLFVPKADVATLNDLRADQADVVGLGLVSGLVMLLNGRANGSPVFISGCRSAPAAHLPADAGGSGTRSARHPRCSS